LGLATRDLNLLLELSDQAFLGAVFAQLDPNADRLGWPPRAVLMEFAHRTRPLAGPWWEHIGRCSPYRTEMRELGWNLRRARRTDVSQSAITLVAR
jgi:hypothetical protein